MAQRMGYHCDCGEQDCAAGGRAINEHESPVVLYLVAGRTHDGEIDGDALPPFVERLLKQPIARIDMHAACAPRVLARLLAETREAPTAPAENPGSPDVAGVVD